MPTIGCRLEHLAAQRTWARPDDRATFRRRRGLVTESRSVLLVKSIADHQNWERLDARLPLVGDVLRSVRWGTPTAPPWLRDAVGELMGTYREGTSGGLGR